eukprot:6764210-Lingulodinium_polyedra.AAC.1
MPSSQAASTGSPAATPACPSRSPTVLTATSPAPCSSPAPAAAARSPATQPTLSGAAAALSAGGDSEQAPAS